MEHMTITPRISHNLSVLFSRILFELQPKALERNWKVFQRGKKKKKILWGEPKQFRALHWNFIVIVIVFRGEFIRWKVTVLRYIKLNPHWDRELYSLSWVHIKTFIALLQSNVWTSEAILAELHYCTKILIVDLERNIEGYELKTSKTICAKN